MALPFVPALPKADVVREVAHVVASRAYELAFMEYGPDPAVVKSKLDLFTEEQWMTLMLRAEAECFQRAD